MLDRILELDNPAASRTDYFLSANFICYPRFDRMFSVRSSLGSVALNETASLVNTPDRKPLNPGSCTGDVSWKESLTRAYFSASTQPRTLGHCG